MSKVDKYDIACSLFAFYCEAKPDIKTTVNTDPYETAEIVLDYYTRLNSKKAMSELIDDIAAVLMTHDLTSETFVTGLIIIRKLNNAIAEDL